MPEKILVVEDSEEVRTGLVIALEGQGYQVYEAADGRDGMQVFRDVSPDLVLLDIRMPRLSGIDVCTLIRNESEVPVIMFSGVEEKADVLLAIRRGADDYVLKDTGFRELMSRVSMHLRKRAAAMSTTRPARLSQDSAPPAQIQSAAPSDAAYVAPAPQSLSSSGKPLPVGIKVQTMRLDDAGADGPDREVLEDLIVTAHSEAGDLEEISEIATRTGYEVQRASTGRQALTIIAARRPKLVMMGNTLTDMSCFELIEGIAQHRLAEVIGLVLAIGRRSPETVRRARYMGVHETVFKPWDDGRLDVAIRSALSATRPARKRLAAA